MEEPTIPNSFEHDDEGNHRLNTPELKKKRDEYILQAIEELKGKISPDKLNANDMDYLTDMIAGLLKEKHKIKSSEDAIEFSDTYPKERIEELLKRHLEMNGSQY